MINYTLNGAWGKTIPDEKLKKALLDFGIELEVEPRRDGLSNININIDDEKILQSKKRAPRKSKATNGDGIAEKGEGAGKVRTKRSTKQIIKN